MSRQPSPGPSQQVFHTTVGATAPPTRTKSKAYSSGIAAGAEDVKYASKYKDLKRKVKDIEGDNDRLFLKILQAKRNIQRAQLERAILYERLSNVPASPPPHSNILPDGMHDVAIVGGAPPLPPQTVVEPQHGHHHRRHGSANNAGHVAVPFNGGSISSGHPDIHSEREHSRHRGDLYHGSGRASVRGPFITIDTADGPIRVATNEHGEPLTYGDSYVTEDMLIKEQRDRERHEYSHERHGYGHHRERDAERSFRGGGIAHLDAPRVSSRSRSRSSHEVGVPPPQPLIPPIPVQGLSRRERESLREIERERERSVRTTRERDHERSEMNNERDREIDWERERERHHHHREHGLGVHPHRPPSGADSMYPRRRAPHDPLVQERHSRRHVQHGVPGSPPPSVGPSPIPAHAQAGALNLVDNGRGTQVGDAGQHQPRTPIQVHMSPSAAHAHAHQHGQHGHHGHNHGHSHSRHTHTHSHAHSHSHGHAHSHSSASANSPRSPAEARAGTFASSSHVHGHQRVGPGANLNLNRDLERGHESEGNMDAPPGVHEYGGERDADMGDVDDERWSGTPPPTDLRSGAWERGREHGHGRGHGHGHVIDA